MSHSPILQMKTMRLRESKALTQLVNVGAKFQAQILRLQSACASRCAGQWELLKASDYPPLHCGCLFPRTVHRACRVTWSGPAELRDSCPQPLQFQQLPWEGCPFSSVRSWGWAHRQGVSAMSPLSSLLWAASASSPASKASNGRKAQYAVPGTLRI